MQQTSERKKSGLKVDIIKDPAAQSLYVEIHCRDITEEVSKLERFIRRYKASIPVTADGEHVKLSLEAVLYIESVDKRTFIYTGQKVYMTDKRLYELEELLDKKEFFRCSKSTIVHLDKIEKLKPEITRNILATLSNGEKIVISRRYAAELKKLIGIGD